MIDWLVCGVMAIGSFSICLSGPGGACVSIFALNFLGLILSARALFAKRMGMNYSESITNQREFNSRTLRAAFNFSNWIGFSHVTMTEQRLLRVFIIGAVSALAAILWSMLRIHMSL